MSSDSKKQDKKATKAATKSHEEIFKGFHSLRAEQRNLANKISEFDSDLNEHKMVIDTLKAVDQDRKCFRVVGGVLVEKTVKEVLPTLETNKEQLTKVIKSMNDQLILKGQEINEYKEKHNIRVRGQDDIPESPAEKATEAKDTRGNVLVNQ